MPLNQGFLSDVFYMDNSGATGLAMTGNQTTAKTYSGAMAPQAGGIALDRGVRYCIQAFWTNNGAPAGTLVLQESNDNINWTTLSGSTATIAAGAIGGEQSYIWKNTADAKFVRVKYTRTSGGTGDNLTCTIRVSTGAR